MQTIFLGAFLFFMIYFEFSDKSNDTLGYTLFLCG
jgi:hypothetical protein